VRRSFIKRSSSPKTVPRRAKFARRGPIRPKKAPALPAWLKAIPDPGKTAHGSGTIQRRLWKVTSDFVRIRDWYKWGHFSVTGPKLYSWQSGQAGHYKGYTRCSGIYKFDDRNIHLQDAQSNAWGTAEDGAHFKEELIRRYGADFVAAIDTDNAATPMKITAEQVMEKIRFYLAEMAALPEQPEYYARCVKLMKEGK